MHEGSAEVRTQGWWRRYGGGTILTVASGIWKLLERADVVEGAYSLAVLLAKHWDSLALLLGLGLIVYEFGKPRGWWRWAGVQSSREAQAPHSTRDAIRSEVEVVVTEKLAAFELSQLSTRLTAMEDARNSARPSNVECFLTICGHWSEALTEIGAFLYHQVYCEVEGAPEAIKLVVTETRRSLGRSAHEFREVNDTIAHLRGRASVSQEMLDRAMSMAKWKIVDYNRDLIKWLAEGVVIHGEGIVAWDRYLSICQMHAEAVTVSHYNRFHSEVGGLALELEKADRPKPWRPLDSGASNT